VTDRWGRVAWGPVVSSGVQAEERKARQHGSGRRLAGLTSTVPGGAI
jgi:hypothetical protein